MTYKVDGVSITIPPTTGKWMPRTLLGIDGAGHPIYVGTRQFEMRWQLIDQAQMDELQDFFDAIVTTGTSVVSLPWYAAATYVFFDYSGCTMREPEWGTYFTEHPQDVTLLITNIQTGGESAQDG